MKTIKINYVGLIINNMNIYRILDFISVVIEFLIGIYLYKETKKEFRFMMLLEIKLNDVLKDISLIATWNFFSISIMILMYLFFQKCLLVLIFIIIIYSSLFNIMFLCLIVPLCFYKFVEHFDPRVFLIIKKNWKKLVVFILYSNVSNFISITILQIVFNADYSGFKLFIFVYMNIIMIFNLIKKISVNVIIVFFYYNISMWENIINRFLLMGNICTASLCKPFSFLYIDNETENYISIYSLIYKKSYYETIQDLKNVKLHQKIYIRLLLYPYVVISMFLFQIKVNLMFFSRYQKILLIFEQHIFFIEIFYSIQAYLILNDHISKEKPEI